MHFLSLLSVFSTNLHLPIYEQSVGRKAYNRSGQNRKSGPRDNGVLADGGDVSYPCSFIWSQLPRYRRLPAPARVAFLTL